MRAVCLLGTRVEHGRPRVVPSGLQPAAPFRHVSRAPFRHVSTEAAPRDRFHRPLQELWWQTYGEPLPADGAMWRGPLPTDWFLGPPDLGPGEVTAATASSETWLSWITAVPVASCSLCSLGNSSGAPQCSFDASSSRAAFMCEPATITKHIMWRALVPGYLCRERRDLFCDK